MKKGLIPLRRKFVPHQRENLHNDRFLARFEEAKNHHRMEKKINF